MQEIILVVGVAVLGQSVDHQPVDDRLGVEVLIQPCVEVGYRDGINSRFQSFQHVHVPALGEDFLPAECGAVGVGRLQVTAIRGVVRLIELAIAESHPVKHDVVHPLDVEIQADVAVNSDKAWYRPSRG